VKRNPPSALEILIKRKFKKMHERSALRLKKAGIAPTRNVLPFDLQDLIVYLRGRSDRAQMTAWECIYCKRWLVIEELELDHWEPLSRGGSDGLDNLVCTCHRCNQRKGSLTGVEYCALLEFVRLNFTPAGEQVLLVALGSAGQANRLRFSRST
jgi:hypothetical protein